MMVDKLNLSKLLDSIKRHFGFVVITYLAINILVNISRTPFWKKLFF